MDDDLDLLPDQDGDGAPRSRPWGLLAVVVVVALVVVSGLVWVISSATGGSETKPAAASPTATPPAPTTAAGTTPPVPTTAAPTRPIPTIRAPAPPPRTPTPTVRPPTLPPGPTPKPLLVRVPNVIGQRLTSATLTLRAAGFRVAVSGAWVPAPKPDQRRVRAQFPAGGTLAPRGATVVLLVDTVVLFVGNT